MAGKQLTSFVYLKDEAGEQFIFGPDDELPGWAEDFLDSAAQDAGLDEHPAFASRQPAEPESEPDEPKKHPPRKAARNRRDS